MTFPGTTRCAVALVAVFGAFMFATEFAQAGIASVNGSVISFKAKRGEVNDVQAIAKGIEGDFGELFTDASSPIEAGPGCAELADGVFCPFADPVPPPGEKQTIELRLGDGDDRGSSDNPGFFVSGMRVFGGRGADDVGAGSGDGSNAYVRSGPGDDELGCSMNFSAGCTLIGGAGDDDLSSSQTFGVQMRGGRGADRLNVYTFLFISSPTRVFDGGNGNDTIAFAAADSGYRDVRAGRGFDTITYENAGLGGFPGQANVDLQTCPDCSIERLVGSPFDDVIKGDDSSMRFDGGDGDDTIDPGGGWDSVFAGAGNDQVNVGGDRQYDFANCGAGEDTAVADHRDQIAKDCETITRSDGG